jgi:hypothetical protein
MASITAGSGHFLEKGLQSEEGIPMPVTRSLARAFPIALSAVLLTSTVHRSPAAAPEPTPPDAARSALALEVEIKCIDDSTLKLRLLDEKLELITKYGLLQIAVADIRRIEFANRCPHDVAEKIALAISKLGHPDYQVREQATADLKAFRERAYPYVLKATKSDDPEISRRADEVVKHIQGRVPAPQLEPRVNDVIHTDDSKITGRLTAQTLRVQTAQFGEQALKLADARSLRAGSTAVAEELQNWPAAPATLMAYQQQYGKEMTFNLTGFPVGSGQQASVWGTDIYTLDSNLPAAAVHAGVVKPNETSTVRVRIIQSPPQFVSSFRNGLNSTAYGNYNAGAFEFVRK